MAKELKPGPQQVVRRKSDGVIFSYDKAQASNVGSDPKQELELCTLMPDGTIIPDPDTAKAKLAAANKAVAEAQADLASVKTDGKITLAAPAPAPAAVTASTPDNPSLNPSSPSPVTAPSTSKTHPPVETHSPDSGKPSHK